jgi:hypothetical protein
VGGQNIKVVNEVQSNTAGAGGGRADRMFTAMSILGRPRCAICYNIKTPRMDRGNDHALVPRVQVNAVHCFCADRAAEQIQHRPLVDRGDRPDLADAGHRAWAGDDPHIVQRPGVSAAVAQQDQLRGTEGRTCGRGDAAGLGDHGPLRARSDRDILDDIRGQRRIRSVADLRRSQPPVVPSRSTMMLSTCKGCNTITLMITIASSGSTVQPSVSTTLSPSPLACGQWLTPIHAAAAPINVALLATGVLQAVQPPGHEIHSEQGSSPRFGQP